MKLIEVGRDPYHAIGRRVVVEMLFGPDRESVSVALLEDGDLWRQEDSGYAIPEAERVEVDRLLWLHDRQQRKEELDRREREQGKSAFLQGIVEKLTAPRAKPTLPPELEVTVQPTLPALQEAYRDVGRALAEQRQQQAKAHEALAEADPPGWHRLKGGGIVVDDPHPQPAEVGVERGVPPMVLRRAVAVALIESPVDMGLCRERGGLSYLPAGTPFVHIDPEASDEGLRLLRVAIDTEQARRARGDS